MTSAVLDAPHVGMHEMLVATAVVGTVLTATYATLEHGLRTYTIGAARAESQQAARAAMFRLAREIRFTGISSTPDLPAILVAEPSRIVLASDFDADGVSLGRGEQITWQLIGSVLRRNGGTGAGAQPVSNGVRAFELRYYDETGVVTSDVSAIRIVEIALETEHAGPASSLAQGVATRMSTRVRLRNR